jgi:hypothetical protein
MGQIRHVFILGTKNLKRSDHLAGLAVNVKIILK